MASTYCTYPDLVSSPPRNYPIIRRKIKPSWKKICTKLLAFFSVLFLNYPPVSRDSGNNFRFPDIASYNGRLVGWPTWNEACLKLFLVETTRNAPSFLGINRNDWKRKRLFSCIWSFLLQPEKAQTRNMSSTYLLHLPPQPPPLKRLYNRLIFQETSVVLSHFSRIQK